MKKIDRKKSATLFRIDNKPEASVRLNEATKKKDVGPTVVFLRPPF